MPSSSPEQAKTMRAIAHGWHPPKGSKVGKIPVNVAKRFEAADEGKPEPAKRKSRQAWA